jgi:hypothetical protein
MAKMPRRRVWAIVIAAVLGLAGIGVGLGAYVHYQADANATCMNQGATIVTHAGPGGECVGITDGSFHFDPANAELTAVENMIRQEDQRVTAPGSPYASVAYLMPVSATGGVEPIQTLAAQLEGAYALQYYANRNDIQGSGSAPKIRLLIASSGTQGDGWRTAVQDIARARVSQHLVAVAGLGVSISSTMDEVRALTGDGIPVIGSSITADTFDNIKNLVRVSPSNTEEVSALLSFIKPVARTAVLVEDTNPTDSYDTTLVQEFTQGFPDARHAIVDREIYDTAGDPGGSSEAALEVANRIGQMPSDICLAKAGVVLFAGRGRDLATLLGDLADRPCLTQPVTVVTGDDVTDMVVTSRVRQGLASGVTLYYAGNANPDEWSGGSTRTAVSQDGQGFPGFDAIFTHLFPTASLGDGNAMMGYDAMLTASYAIRLTDTLDPTPGGVIDELSALHGTRVVYGASGPIVLFANYQKNGTGSNPVGKPIPILRLEPDGSVRFVQLDWPDGQPPA